MIKMKEKEEEKIDRRDLLKGIGGLGATTLSGCARLLGPDAEEIQRQVNQTEESLQSEVPWNSYKLKYIPKSIKLSKDRLQRTGVEDAYTYRINISFDMADNSDDLSGWMATSERREEFFSLLNETTYDVLNNTVDDFNQFQPENQPSNFNQVVEYRLHVGAEGCSYLENIVPSEVTSQILGSRSAYDSYVGSGEDYDIRIEEASLGIEYFC